MDDRVQTILDTYHEIIRAQRERPHETPWSDDGRDQKLRAVGPETGRLLNVLARSLEKPAILELGTSFGYSGIWLADGARASGGHVVTMELHDYKSAFAAEMAEKAGLSAFIDFRVGDAVAMIGELRGGFDLVLVDLWKDLYVPCLEAFYPLLNPGAIIVADNVGPGQSSTRPYVEAVRKKSHIASLSLPVGQGIEISRFHTI